MTWKHTIWLLAAIASLWGGAAAAETYTVGSIGIGNPWARATPKGAPVGGAYMTITNKGAEADRLIGVTSPVANQTEVHQMTMDKGVMSMRPVPGGLEIKPGHSVVFNPESFQAAAGPRRAGEGDARFRKGWKARSRIRGRVDGRARPERCGPRHGSRRDGPWRDGPWCDGQYEDEPLEHFQENARPRGGGGGIRFSVRKCDNAKMLERFM
jgi:hypothetical protein